MDNLLRFSTPKRTGSPDLFPELQRQQLVRLWQTPAPVPRDLEPDPTPLFASLGGAIAANHHENGLLWYHEDRVRCPHATDATIVRHKRAIDRHNGQRNRAAQAIDEHLFARLSQVSVRHDARRNSETPGSIVDRLSIASLRLTALAALMLDGARSEAQRQNSERAAEQVTRQREDLLECLQELLEDLSLGRARLRLYRQFKMYDDPQSNPFLLAK